MLRVLSLTTILMGTLLSGCADWKGAAVQAVESAEAPTAESQAFGLAAIIRPDPYRAVLYLGDSDHNFVHVLDAETMQIQESIYVGGQPRALNVVGAGRYLKVDLIDMGHYAIVDLEKRELVMLRENEQPAVAQQ